MERPDTAHRTVMLAEMLSFLAPSAAGVYADATCGHGYGAEAIMESCGPGGRLLAVDIDPVAVDAARSRLARFGERCIVVRGSYVDLKELATSAGFAELDGIVMDCGAVSREQIMNPERGLSFFVDGELNMKLDPDQPGPTAADLVNTLPTRDLARLLREAGESRTAARVIVSAIGRARSHSPISRTTQLARIVEDAVDAAGVRRGARHPATRAFLALRTAVTQELPTLERGLHEALSCLREGGRLCVLSYYGTEHGLVRKTLRQSQRGCVCPPDLPVCGCGRKPLVRSVVSTPLSPSKRETVANESSRSARLHVVERTSAPM